MKINLVVGVIGGLVVGVIGGVLSTKKYFKDKYEKMYQSDREYLLYLHDNHGQTEDSGDDILINEPDEPEEQEETEHLTDEQRAEIKRKLKDNHKRTTNYAEMYKKRTVEEDAADEELSSDEPEWTIEEIEKWHKEHLDDEPYIIDYDDIDGLPPMIEQKNLKLYFYDDTLVDEDTDEEINDPETIVGGCIDNFIDNQEERICVLNNSIETVYVIRKVWNSFYNPDPEGDE